jgi:hydroxymethylglutaryl-CoA lyase
MTKHIEMREVGLRDGLQMVKSDLPTERKLEWMEDAIEAGIKEIEVTSFVPPKTFPIFADAAVIARAALGKASLIPSALVVNMRGAQDAFHAGLKRVSYIVSASEAHSMANVRRTTDEAIAEFGRIVAFRDSLGLAGTVELSCGIGTAFGCSIQGEVQSERVIDIASQLSVLGASEILVADTVGYGNPAQVEALFGTMATRLPAMQLAAHFHDTRGLGLANIAAAARVGIRRFDASLGGLGGCPFAPGATGNVNLEDSVFMLEAMGFETGIDVAKLVALQAKVAGWLPAEKVTGAIARAGLPKTFPSLH